MADQTSVGRATRREVIRLAGVAALGAAGAAALGTTRVRAAGSGDTVDLFWNPQKFIDTRGHPKLAAGAEVAVGPFPVPGFPAFMSDDYLGFIGNLTATRWTGAGWLSVRPSGMPFDLVNGARLLHFGGSIAAISNFFVCQFGPPTVGGKSSDGKLIIHNGGPGATNLVLDFHGYLGPDQ